MRVPADFSLDNFTLDYWIGQNLDTIALRTGILLTADLWHAAWNTLRIVGIASLCSGLLGLMVGYVVVRARVRPVAGFLRQVTFFPYLVPGIAFGAAYLSLFAVPRGPIPALYGTAVILILALAADQMPYASRAGISAMLQLGKDPEEAAQIAGAGWLRRMILVVIPIQKGSLVCGPSIGRRIRPECVDRGGQGRRTDHGLRQYRKDQEGRRRLHQEVRH
jgi:iron(III) transport system permease protein